MKTKIYQHFLFATCEKKLIHFNPSFVFHYQASLIIIFPLAETITIYHKNTTQQNAGWCYNHQAISTVHVHARPYFSFVISSESSIGKAATSLTFLA